MCPGEAEKFPSHHFFSHVAPTPLLQLYLTQAWANSAKHSVKTKMSFCELVYAGYAAKSESAEGMAIPLGQLIQPWIPIQPEVKTRE